MISTIAALLVALLVGTAAFSAGFLVGGRHEAKASELRREEFLRRTIASQRAGRDGQKASRQESRPARVKTAHVSQRRSSWK